MAIALRELLARYDLEFDDKNFKKADKTISGTARALRGLGAILVGGTVGRGFVGLINMASDAEEQLNVVTETFKDQSGVVTEWASTLATEVGRSEFQLRKIAGTLGAILVPQLEGNRKRAAEMSTTLGALAIDLRSFFNLASDDDALLKLQAGITGETEPLKRLGIQLQDVNLQEFARRQGITKSIQKMNIREKTELRYAKILDDAKDKIGDARRTQEGYANASIAVANAFRDLATRVGLVALPAISRMAAATAKNVRGFTEAARKSAIFEAALIVLAGAATVAGVALAVAFGGPLLRVLKFVGIVGALIFLVDELIVLFRGGETVIGKFIDEMFGVGTAAELVRTLKADSQELVDFYRDSVIPIMEMFGSVVFDAVQIAKEAINSFNQATLAAIAGTIEGFDQMKTDVGEIATFIQDTWNGAWMSVLDTFETVKRSILDGLGLLQGAVAPVARFLGIDLPDPTPRQGGTESAQTQRARRRREISTERTERSVDVPIDRAKGRGVDSPVFPRLRTSGQVLLNKNRTPGASVSQNMTVNVTVPAGSSRQQATEVAQQVRKVIREENRKAIDAVKQQGGGV